jgi:hypothetical protein
MTQDSFNYYSLIILGLQTAASLASAYLALRTIRSFRESVNYTFNHNLFLEILSYIDQCRSLFLEARGRVITRPVTFPSTIAVKVTDDNRGTLEIHYFPFYILDQDEGLFQKTEERLSLASHLAGSALISEWKNIARLKNRVKAASYDLVNLDLDPDELATERANAARSICQSTDDADNIQSQFDDSYRRIQSICLHYALRHKYI